MCDIYVIDIFNFFYIFQASKKYYMKRVFRIQHQIVTQDFKANFDDVNERRACLSHCVLLLKYDALGICKIPAGLTGDRHQL